MLKRLLKTICTRVLRARGYSGFFAPRVCQAYIKDLLEGAKLGFRRRLWAYRHGFLGDRLVNYRLTDHNVSDYVPDLLYLKLHPLNAPWSKWIDDKLTFRYVLARFSEHLPKYYFHMLGRDVCRLMDCPEGLSADVKGVTDLLQTENALAVKTVAGSGGKGFHKLSQSNGKLFMNNEEVSIKQCHLFLGNCRDHLVTEYLTPHAELRRIYPHTTNTIRVCSIHEPGRDVEIVGAFIRFGTSKSGVVDNVGAGGIFSGVRTEDGTLFKAGRYDKAEFIEVDAHPDTGVPIRGTLPYWGAVKEAVVKVCAYLPQLPYLGFDVVLTDDGFKFIEINSHQSIQAFQQYYPLLRNATSQRFFLRAFESRGIRLVRS